MKKILIKIYFVSLVSIFGLFGVCAPAFAANIYVVNKWAWNSILGWINFAPDATLGTADVTMKQTAPYTLTGYANSAVGKIYLDCVAYTNNKDPLDPVATCGSFPLWGVTWDSLTRKFSNYAWSPAIGWVSFSGVGYSVSLDANGNFEGYAWNDIAGWIRFNCNGDATGCVPAYHVQTTPPFVAAQEGYLESSTFYTGVINGAKLNAVVLRRTVPSGALVEMWLASSNNANGPWVWDATTYLGDNNILQDDVPTAIPLSGHNNVRYFRYRLHLKPDASGVNKPIVDNVIIHWSP